MSFSIVVAHESFNLTQFIFDGDQSVRKYGSTQFIFAARKVYNQRFVTNATKDSEDQEMKTVTRRYNKK
jgi:hypothetical protein